MAESKSRSDADPFPEAVKRLDRRDALRSARAALMKAWEKSGEGALGPVATVLSGLDAILHGKPLPWATTPRSERGAWIGVKDRTPPNSEVVVLTNGEWISTGYWNGVVWFLDVQHESDPKLHPVYWMPLPAAPK